MKSSPPPRCHGALVLTALVLAACACLALPGLVAADAPAVHALTGVRIVVAPGKVVEHGTVVVRDGLIEAAGADVEPPPDARIWDLEGLTVYPGLIESYAERPWPDEAAGEGGPSGGGGGGRRGRPGGAATQPDTGSGNPNPAVHAEREMTDHAEDAAAARQLREAGFTVAVIAPKGGVLRGQSVLIDLGDGPVRERILEPRVAQNVTLSASAPHGYPRSLMGSIALTRQTFLDAGWYRRAWSAFDARPTQRRPPYDAALEALGDAAAGDQPVVFENDDLPGEVRAAHLADELGLDAWFVGSGEEYQRLDEVRQILAGHGHPRPVLLPVAFPEPPAGSSGPLSIELDALRHWKRAPENPAALVGTGATVALTTFGLDRPADIHERLARAIAAGLSPDDALAGVTTIPARLLGISAQRGTIEPGKAADLVVVDGDLFTEKTKVREVWIDGKRYEIKKSAPPEVEPAGTWDLRIDAGGETVTSRLDLVGDAPSLTGTLEAQGAEITLDSAEVSGSTVEIAFDGASFGMPGPFTLTLEITGDSARGSGSGPPGPFTLTGTRVSAPPEVLR